MAIVRVPVTIEHPFAGGPAMNVWHARLVDNNPETWQLGDALDALYDFYNAVRLLYPNTTVIRFGEGMIRDPLGSPEYVDDDSRSIVVSGGQTGTVATKLAIVASWRTTSASRSGRGRTFVGPLQTATAQGDGTPRAQDVTTVRQAGEALVSASQGANGWAFGVLSVRQGLLRDFTGVSVRDRFAFLSSRRD